MSQWVWLRCALARRARARPFRPVCPAGTAARLKITWLPGIELRRSQVKIVGQKRPEAGQGERRAGHFARSATKQRLESGLSLTVGQPRRNAPFLTHDQRCIPYGGIPAERAETRRNPQRIERTGFTAGAPAGWRAGRPSTKGTFISRGRGTGPPSRRWRIVVRAMARDGTCNDPLSLSRTTGCPVCPGCGHPGTRPSRRTALTGTTRH
jgi:hypothetical protein